MAEENKVVEPEVKQEPVKQEPVQLTAIEERASAQGWRPKDEWDGDPDEWVSAREFVRAGELFKKIDDQNRTLKEFRKTIDELAKHNSKIAKVEYDRALNDLRAKKKEALELGDADAVIEVDDKIAAVREAQREAPAVATPQVPGVNPIFESWVSRNGWYNNQPAMKAYADRIGTELGGQMSPTDLLAHVEKEVKKEFAHKFNNPKREEPSAVEGSTNKSGKGKSYALSDEERRVMQRFVKTVPGMTEEKYIADLRKIKGE